jgi:hypothetical protein
MAKELQMPLGRMTIRQSGGRRTRLWEQTNSKIPTVQRLENVYLSGLSTMDLVESRHASNKKDVRFTPEGARDDLLQFALKEAVPALHHGRVMIRKARDELAERRSKLKLPAADPTDIAALMRRQEIRQHLNTMKPEKQAEYFLKNGDNLPAEVSQAIVELPAEFSGVPQSRHDLLTEDALSKQFGEAIAEIKEIEQAIEAAESSVEASRAEIREEVGVDPVKFDELARPIEAKQSAPWLRKSRENGADVIRVVDLEKRVERVATPEEIETGVYYRDYESYIRKDVA